MRVLFANIPYIWYDGEQIFTGPNAGSRWPFLLKGRTDYACFPFFMANAATYLKAHDVDARFYDGVAQYHYDYEKVFASIIAEKPDVLVLEIATPTKTQVLAMAERVKAATQCKVVLVGPHVPTYAEELLSHPFVDHCVKGEYEQGCLAIVRGDTRRLFDYWPVDQIDTLNGSNWLPHWPEYMANYWDQSMATARPQHPVSTSRGCPWKCAFCSWPEVMNNRKFRVRSPEMVLDEIYQAKSRFKIGSLFFDDDTWNTGTKRVKAICDGLKRIGLPWTMMGRADASGLESYQWMQDAGCVGMRFGVESFHQHLLDRVDKHMDGAKNYENLKYLAENMRGMEFHLTTMINMPGEQPGEWEQDLEKLKRLQEIAGRHGNRLHWQTSECQTFPGTKLWQLTTGKSKIAPEPVAATLGA